MPSYEMSLILKVLSRPQTLSALKRTVEEVSRRGGILRGIENVGERQLPYKMSKHGVRYSQGSYFVVNFDSSSDILLGLKEHLTEDLDVIRPRILRREIEVGRPCDTKQCHFEELTEAIHTECRNDQEKYIKKL